MCDDGLLKLADELIVTGTWYGSILAKDGLPRPMMVSRKVTEAARVLREALKLSIQAAMKERCCWFTADMPTDIYKTVSHITATAHYVNESWELKSLVLFTSDFPPEKTGDNIRREILCRLAKMVFDKPISVKSVFATNQGADIITALHFYSSMNCSAHLLNTVPRHTFDESRVAQELPKSHKQMRKVIAAVTLLKLRGISSQLPYSVCQEVSM